MDRFCIVYNTSKEKAKNCSKEIYDYLIKKGKYCVIADSSTNLDDIDCIIVLGGDGTMIQAAHDTDTKDIPLYGVNLGGVGYLTESDPDDNLWKDIDDLINDDFRIEKRIMLNATVNKQDGSLSFNALNDVVLSKREIGNLIGFEVYVNDTLLSSFFADGIIISTPTGSTGYNISAGGPILSPLSNVICVTPICPHSLNDRSFVISGDDTVTLKLTEGKNADIDSGMVVADGRSFANIVTGDTVYVEKSEYYTSIILKKDTNFYKRVRSKLNR